MLENTTSTRIPGSKSKCLSLKVKNLSNQSHTVYGCAQVSPNRNIICAMPLADSPADCQPSLAAIPLTDDNSKSLCQFGNMNLN